MYSEKYYRCKLSLSSLVKELDIMAGHADLDTTRSSSTRSFQSCFTPFCYGGKAQLAYFHQLSSAFESKVRRFSVNWQRENRKVLNARIHFALRVWPGKLFIFMEKSSICKCSLYHPFYLKKVGASPISEANSGILFFKSVCCLGPVRPLLFSNFLNVILNFTIHSSFLYLSNIFNPQNQIFSICLGAKYYAVQPIIHQD